MKASLPERILRRLLDLVAASIGMIILAPVMAVIAVFIKRDSEGPVIFTQERIGKGGRPFSLYKFRTMRTEPGPMVTAGGDPRITPIGAKLRSAKLDELPQLANVAKGDMSLVGPRPEVARFVDMWPVEARRTILTVRPGITDPVTLELRREEELLHDQPDPERYYREVLLPRKAAAYSAYVKRRTLASDAMLLLQTLRAVLRE